MTEVSSSSPQPNQIEKFVKLSMYATAGLFISYELLAWLGQVLFISSGAGEIQWQLFLWLAFDVISVGLLTFAAFAKRISLNLRFLLSLSAFLFGTLIANIVSYLTYGYDLIKFVFQISFITDQLPFASFYNVFLRYQVLNIQEADISSQIWFVAVILRSCAQVAAFAMAIFFVISITKNKKTQQTASAGAPQPANVTIPQGAPNMSMPYGFPQQGFNSTWIIAIPGYPQEPLNVFQLRQMAVMGSINASTPLKDSASGNIYMAKSVPGIFSRREYVTALLLSIFLGSLGIDRFYLGQTGLGIGKLLTFGGCGIWSLIDLILIAMRKVTDNEGLPLA